MWVGPGDYKVVGECLAATRKSANVSQDELAARLEKPQSFVSAYERGQRRVDLLEFLLILDALKVDPFKVFATIMERAQEIVRKGSRRRNKYPTKR